MRSDGKAINFNMKKSKIMKIEKHLVIDRDNSDYDIIGNYISSKDSVVGIDARHTHIIIISKLIQLEKKLTKLSKKLKHLESGKKKQ